jgi:Mg2+ and Co2+ transporter CorA
MQFLNMLQSRINDALTRTSKADTATRVVELRCLIVMLDRHSQVLHENTTFLRKRGGPQWPRSRHQDHVKTVDATMGILHQDFELLTERTSALNDLCQQSMSVIMHKIALKEAQDSVQQGRPILLFTTVTIIFLPLSFISSVFSMNVEELGGPSHVRLAMFWVVTLPVALTIINFLVWFNLCPAIKRRTIRLAESLMGVGWIESLVGIQRMKSKELEKGRNGGRL